MEKLEIIRERSFGDKFNELTSFIYDNFGVLCKWALIFVTPVALVVTAIIKYMPDITSVNILKMSLCVILISILSITLNTIAMHYYEDGIELRELSARKYLVEILRNMGVGIVASIVFIIIVSIVANATSGLINNDGKFPLFTLGLYSVIVALFAMPVFYTHSAVIIDGRNGNGAIKRALKLMIYRPFKAMLFLFTMTIIGLILPTIASIPYHIILNVHSIFGPGGGFIFSEDAKPLLEFLTLSLSIFCYILDILAMGVGMMFEYGNAVEKADNVSFMKKFNNFENL